MRLRLGSFPLILLLLGLLTPGLLAQNAAPASLQEQLTAQYQPVKLGADSNGLNITQPGTVLVIQKGGILGVKPTSIAACPAKFQDGALKGPNGFCAAMVKDVSRLFIVGQKVYVSKIDVNAAKDKVSLTLLDCDSCNGTNPPEYYKSEVVFQFAKGYMKTAGVPQVEDTIAQVFTIDEGGDQGGQQAQNNQGGDQQQQPAAAPQNQQPGPPPNIQIGQTIDEVVAALGQPDKTVNLGAKQIYVYKDLKVIFMNGKVKDVE